MKILKPGITFALSLVSLHLMMAQTPGAVRAPAEIASARKVYISNAGVKGNFAALYSGGQNRVYTGFYTGLKKWGRYELVPLAAYADMVFEVSLDMGGADGKPQLNVRVLEPRTNLVLSTVSQPIQQTSATQSSRDKGLDQAIAELLTQVKSLSGAAAAPGGR